MAYIAGMNEKDFSAKMPEIRAATICLTLGTVYQDGKICPRNLKKAREYYAEGVKRGNKNCQKALEELK